MIAPDITVGLQTYGIALQTLKRAYYDATADHDQWFVPSTSTVQVEIRRRYAKIVCEAHGSRSVYSYVDLTDGYVVKGNWKSVETAVLHIKRGNVLDGSWLDWHGPHGIGYADGIGGGHGHFRSMIDDASYMVAKDAVQAGDGARASVILADAVTAWVASYRAARAALKTEAKTSQAD